MTVDRHRVIDTLHFGLSTHGVYNYVVTNYMDPLALAKIPLYVPLMYGVEFALH